VIELEPLPNNVNKLWWKKQSSMDLSVIKQDEKPNVQVKNFSIDFDNNQEKRISENYHKNCIA